MQSGEDGAAASRRSELIDPKSGAAIALEDGAAGEPVLTHLRQRDVLVVQTEVDLLPWGSLPRSEYKSRLVEH